MQGMPIAFITLKMVCSLARTTRDASNLSCQSLYQVHFVYRSKFSGIVTQSKFNNTCVQSLGSLFCHESLEGGRDKTCTFIP
jgi:hypothetical protein